MNDDEILPLLQNNDRCQWQKTYDHYYREFLREFAGRFTFIADELDDAFQLAIAAFGNNIMTKKPGDFPYGLYAYFRGIARNTLYNMIRGKKNDNGYIIKLYDINSIAVDDELSYILLRRDREQVVDHCICELTYHEKKVLVGHVRLKYSNAQLAAALGLKNENVAKQEVQKMKEKIKKISGRYYGEGG